MAILFEKLVFKHFYNHLKDNNMLSPSQLGFIPGDSTLNQLAYLYHIFTEALGGGKEVGTVFCDISKAFDCVCHKILFTNLELLVFQETSSDVFKATSQDASACSASR